MTLDRRAWLAGAGALAGLGLAGCAAGPSPSPMISTPPHDHAARLPGTWQQDRADPASGHVWRLWLQRPALPAPPGGYPLLVLLDGNASFALGAQLARNAESRPAHVRPDPLIVAAIGHPGDGAFHPAWRLRDYTPPAPGHPPAADRGGADALLGFIERELLPEARRLGPVDAGRTTLFGHSLGGLFVLHGLLQRPDLFARHVAASPSVWWNGGQILHEVDRFIARHQGARPFHTRLELSMGEREAREQAPSAERAAVRSERQSLERTRSLAERLRALRWPELTVDFAIRPGLDHGDMLWRGLLDGLG